jgi:hypothetical protein
VKNELKKKLDFLMMFVFPLKLKIDWDATVYFEASLGTDLIDQWLNHDGNQRF